MGISRITALTIHSPGNDIRCGAGGPDETGKFAGFIWLYRNDKLHCCLVSTKPIYDSEEDAKAAMAALVREIREEDIADIIG